MTARSPLALRFHAKVAAVGNVCECWIWTGAQLPSGCGMIWVGGDLKVARAPRVAWELAYGPIPDGLYVCHHCDNPPCVNPYHLFLGTAQDNVDDMIAKGRGRPSGVLPLRVYGAQNGAAKLTPELVREIRKARGAGESFTAIARRLGISRTGAWQVDRGITWSHVR